MDNIKEPIKRKKFIILAVVLLVLAGGLLLIFVYHPDWIFSPLANLGIGNQAAEKNKTAYVDEATKKIGESQIPKLDEKTVAEPNNPDAWRDLGRAEYLSGDPEAAAISFNKAIALNDGDPQFYVDLGRVYEAEGDLAKAEEYYKKAIELNGTEIKTVNSPSETLTAEQLAILEKAGNLEPKPKSYYNLVTPYTALGSLYLMSDKPNEAIKVLESGIAMNPKYSDFYQLLSEAYKKSGNKTKAAEAEENFKALVPSFSVTP
ncbi:MAG: tetratricopeptide repeat protein [Minisyncoccia bacterium]